MKLCCRITGEDMDLFSFLNSEGLQPQLMRGCIEGTFDEKYADNQGRYYIADFPEETEYFLKLYESGGGMTKTGFGQIICGLKGEKLYPKEVYTTGHLSNAKHAEFQETEAIEITSTKNGSIRVKYAQVAINKGKSVKIGMLDIWEGNIQYIPETFNYFTKAITTAYTKANDYHCRKAHYIEGFM